MRQNEEAGAAGDVPRALPIERAGPAQGIGPQARKRIGSHLRTMYEAVLRQPVPDRFVDLVARLDETLPERAPDAAGPLATHEGV